jgi:hypothetical protein
MYKVKLPAYKKNFRTAGVLVGAVLAIILLHFAIDRPYTAQAITIRSAGALLNPGDVTSSIIRDATILNVDVAGAAGISILKLGGVASGSVPFMSASSFNGTTSALYFDGYYNRLVIGSSTPTQGASTTNSLVVIGTTTLTNLVATGTTILGNTTVNGTLTVTGNGVFVEAVLAAQYSNDDIGTTTTLFDGESFDSNNLHSTSVNNDRITIATTGYYLLGGCAYPTWANASTGTIGVEIDKNGVGDTANRLATQLDYVVGSGHTVCVTTTASLAANDYITLGRFNNAGSTHFYQVSPNNRFWAYRIGY